MIHKSINGKWTEANKEQAQARFNRTHWTYPNESITRFNQIYTACKIYVHIDKIRYAEGQITCKKCKELMIEFESTEIEL